MNPLSYNFELLPHCAYYKSFMVIHDIPSGLDRLLIYFMPV